MSFTSFENADSIVHRLITLLDEKGITPAIGKPIEGEMLSPLQLLEATRNMDQLAHRPELLTDAGGMYDLAAKVLAVETAGEFPTFLPHLKLFAAGEAFATAVQAKNADVRDHTNRKLAELYLGSLAVHIGFNVALDDPHASQGDNPDVMFDFEANGHPRTRWALAIKTVHSDKGQTIFENIKKAAAQVDAPACQAERGIVVINLKNSLNHAQLWGTTHASGQEGRDALNAQMLQRINACQQDRDASDWEQLFAGRTSPMVMFYAHAVVPCTVAGIVLPTVLKVCAPVNPLSRRDDVAAEIIGGLNEFMQRILKGIPGTPDSGTWPS